MKKWRLNLFDLAVIVLAIAAGAAFLYLQRGAGVVTGSTSGTTVRYVIEITNLPKEAAGKIKVGDSVTDKVEKHALGRVIDFEIVDYKVSTRDLTTGDYRLRAVPERFTALLTLESPAAESATNITIDGAFVVRCGTEVSALGPGYGGVGYIVKIER
ncbi:MAG: DUF4330 domain-containing protein [Oscillospiraceae bacterium]|jgi:hypothetical protein|nr:DUF4330 domain-containing protein [Oscillospiraceae bacterium]